ncbi:SLC13 family permease [Leifsonia sp. Leaf264]|uniref:SLC13 family permease n=1 Tax=Leifsonia sp. Leaf264 TaxID=1736314 RepID=UPI0009E85AC8|nr:SLC13 family permease [Leifsonia sp. Leaf264]
MASVWPTSWHARHRRVRRAEFPSTASATVGPVTDSALTLIILALAVIAFVSGRIPTGLVAIGVSLALLATGVLDLQQAFAGFADPAVVLIAALFVVAEGLDGSGLTSWAGQQLVRRGGGELRRLTVLVMVVVAVLSALISVNGAVAALLPVVVVIASRILVAPSKLLLPLAFGAHAGSLLTLTGSPVNVLASEYAATATGHPFGFFDFAVAGAPIIIGSVLLVLLLQRFVIPDRTPATMPRDLSDQARVLLRDYPGLLTDAAEPTLLDAGTGVAEVLVPPRSAFVGATVFPGMVTESGDLVILAVQRAGEHLEHGEIVLEVGDVLLLQGDWDALDANLADPEIVVVDAPDAVRRQAAPLGRRAWTAAGILVFMVVALATGVFPPAVTGLLAAGAMVLTRTVSVERAHRSISWTTLLLVAGMIPMSTAITQTGTAEMIANGLIGIVGDSGPIVVLGALCLVALVFGQLISNTATALIILPIAISVAAELQVSPLPFLMAVAVVSAAALLTPVATPANLMIQGPAGLRFGDYWKLGLPVMAVFLAVAVGIVPLVWRF